MREQFPETEHHAVHEGKEQINGRAAEERPDGRGLVYYHGARGGMVL